MSKNTCRINKQKERFYFKRIEEGPSEKTEHSERQDKYLCKVYGYIHGSKNSGMDRVMSHGTSFRGLPDYWACLKCGVNKSLFEKNGGEKHE